MRILASEARRISDNSQHPKFDDYTDIIFREIEEKAKMGHTRIKCTLPFHTGMEQKLIAEYFKEYGYIVNYRLTETNETEFTVIWDELRCI